MLAASAQAQMTPQELAAASAAFGGFSDRQLRQAMAYELAQLSGTTLPGAITNSTSLGGLSDYQLACLEVYLLNQIASVGGSATNLTPWTQRHQRQQQSPDQRGDCPGRCFRWGWFGIDWHRHASQLNHAHDAPKRGDQCVAEGRHRSDAEHGQHAQPDQLLQRLELEPGGARDDVWQLGGSVAHGRENERPLAIVQPDPSGLYGRILQRRGRGCVG